VTTLNQQIIALAQAMGADVKAVKASVGDVTALSTTAKTSLVAAVNELFGLLSSAGVSINDSAGAGATTVTWSASKSVSYIASAISTLQATLVGGASSAMDTFKELQDIITSDESFAATLATSLSNKLDFSMSQSLTAPQQLTACTNLGIGDPTTDLVGAYTTAKS
jgi:hypothetical protein